MNKNKPYLFLIGWIDSCESSGWIKSEIHYPSDLYKQLKKDSEHVFAVIIEAPNEDVALSYGYRTAFFNNFTAHDTFSDCFPITSGVRRVLNRVMGKGGYTPVIVEL